MGAAASRQSVARFACTRSNLTPRRSHTRSSSNSLRASTTLAVELRGGSCSPQAQAMVEGRSTSGQRRDRMPAAGRAASRDPAAWRTMAQTNTWRRVRCWRCLPRWPQLCGARCARSQAGGWRTRFETTVAMPSMILRVIRRASAGRLVRAMSSRSTTSCHSRQSADRGMMTW